MSEELFERILGSLHEAVLDDELWPVPSGLIDDYCGTKGNFLITGDGMSEGDIEIFFARFCYRGQRNPELERLYFGKYHRHDERLPRVRQLPDSRVVHNSSLYTEDEMKTSAVYNDLLLGSDAGNTLSVRLDGPGGSRIAWTMGDPVDGDGWSSTRVEKIEHLLPHLRQYVRVRQALIDARAQSASFAALLENTRCGVIHLDVRGRIVAANDIARAILRKGDGLADREGLPHATSDKDDDALQNLLARALARFGARGESGSITLKRRSLSPRLVLHASPVGTGPTDVRASRIAALLLVVDPAFQGRIDPDLVGGALGLTQAESHVAVLLAHGRTIRDIAASTGRSEGTVRWHTKRIFARLGISRQTELVQLVLSLCDIPQART